MTNEGLFQNGNVLITPGKSLAVQQNQLRSNVLADRNGWRQEASSKARRTGWLGAEMATASSWEVITKENPDWKDLSKGKVSRRR